MRGLTGHWGNMFWALWWLVASATAAVGGNAATAPASPVWPAPPAEPRIRYVQSISCPADFGMRSPFWSRFAGLLTGNRPDRLELGKPFGVAVAEDGNLFVTDTGAGVVWCFTTAERRFRRWDTLGTTRLLCPVSAIGKGDQLFVADSALGKVLVSDLKGKMRFEITDVERPSGLTLCGGLLFVADAGAHCVVAFDLQGKLVRRFGKRGTEPGEFNSPTHIAADAGNRLLVTDSLNERIQLFDLEGRYLGTLGGPGDGSGRFSRPKGVAADGFGHIYVTDALHDNVQVFDGTGRFLMHWGESGSGPGEFWMPAGIAIGRQNEVFVADSYNRRIQVFQYVGKE